MKKCHDLRGGDFLTHTVLPAADCLPRQSADSSRQVTIGWLNNESLHKKTDDVNLAITERTLHVLALTETWHTACSDTV